MPTDSEDVVKQVREALGNGSVLLPLCVEHWHMSVSGGGWYIKNASNEILMTVRFVPVEIETGKPFPDGNPPVRAIVALLNAVPSLCDEVERLRAGVEHVKRLRKDVYYDSRERQVADTILKGFEHHA